MSSVCPIDGCKSRHDTRNGVVQHIFMSESGGHGEFEDKGEAWEAVITNADNDGVNDDDNDNADRLDNDDGAGGLEFPEAQDNDNDNEILDQDSARGALDEDRDDDGHSCPDCGHGDWFDSAEVLRAGEFGPKETAELLDNDRVCSDCGEVF